MAVFCHELKRSIKGFVIWTAAITFMLIVCVIMFPSMKSQMSQVTDMFANMGDFSAAFGIDKVSIGTMIGFYGTECGNVLGIGGGFYAAFLGAAMLSKEEKEHTAEFLLSHPISRKSVILQKMSAMVTIIVVMNLIISIFSFLSIVLIGENVSFVSFFLVHLGYLILQLEIALICFGISAFIKHGGTGIGIGLAAMLYFLNIISNISEDADILKYITPYSYSDATSVISTNSIEVKYLIPGLVIMIVFPIVGLIKYNKKDISA